MVQFIVLHQVFNAVISSWFCGGVAAIVEEHIGSQFFSSEWSWQWTYPSQWYIFEMHDPSAQRKWPGWHVCLSERAVRWNIGLPTTSAQSNFVSSTNFSGKNWSMFDSICQVEHPPLVVLVFRGLELWYIR